MTQIRFPMLSGDGQASNGDLLRLISFASDEIESIEDQKDELLINLRGGANEDEVLGKIQRVIKHRKSSNQQKTKYVTGDAFRSYFTDFPDELVKNYGNGLVSLRGEAFRLLCFFDDKFKEIALSLSAEETQYPVLLPIESMAKTGYFRTSPQYSMFVCHPKEDIDELTKVHREVVRGKVTSLVDEPRLTLSPAACFHCYMDLEQANLRQPSIYTFKQKVFRHEGRMNWSGFGRLREYYVREIVFFGDEVFVRDRQNKALELVKRFVEKLGLSARICATSDPFVIPTMQKYKDVQLEEESKLELQLTYDQDDYLAVASFNIHGSAFTTPFEIEVQGIEHPVSGCIGFGLERWVLAFMAQNGSDPARWRELLEVGDLLEEDMDD